MYNVSCDMHRLITLTLLASLLASASGCASMRRYPVLYGMAVGGSVGLTYGLLTNHHCPSVINGYPYQGNQKPCPYNWDPGPKH